MFNKNSSKLLKIGMTQLGRKIFISWYIFLVLHLGSTSFSHLLICRPECLSEQLCCRYHSPQTGTPQQCNLGQRHSSSVSLSWTVVAEGSSGPHSNADYWHVSHHVVMAEGAIGEGGNISFHSKNFKSRNVNGSC